MNSKEEPIFVVRQNIFVPLASIITSITLGFFIVYLVNLYGHPPKQWSIMIIGILIFFMTAHIFKRLFSWNFIFLSDQIILKRLFGVIKRNTKQIKLNEVNKVHLSFGFLMDCKLEIHTKTDKRYLAFFDKKPAIGNKLISLCTKNGIEISSSGGKWSF